MNGPQTGVIADRWDQSADSERRRAAKALIRAVWVFPVGRGIVYRPEHRIALKWADDDRQRTLEELRAPLVPRP